MTYEELERKVSGTYEELLEKYDTGAGTMQFAGPFRRRVDRSKEDRDIDQETQTKGN